MKDYGGNSLTITVPSNHYHLCGGTEITNTETTADGITAYRYIQDFDRS